MLIQSSITTSYPEILSTADWVGVLARTAMTKPGWHEAVCDSGRKLAADRLKLLQRLSARHKASLEAVLRNAVALALRDKKEWIDALYLILSRLPEEESWARGLQSTLSRAVPVHSWARIFDATSQDLPKSANPDGLLPTLRWQVTLAIRTCSPTPVTSRLLIDDLRRNVDVPMASLVGLLREYLDVRPIQRRIPADRFSSLPLIARVLVLRSRRIRDGLVASPSNAVLAYRPEVRQRWATASTIRRRLPTLLAALRRRDYSALEQLVSELADLPYAREEVRAYGKQVASAIRTPGANAVGTWQPIPTDVRSFLESAVEGITEAARILALLGCTAKQVFDQAIARTTPNLGSLLRGPDLIRLHRTWTAAQKQQLLSVGRRDLLSDGEIKALKTAAATRAKREFEAFLEGLKRWPTPDVVDALQAKWSNEREAREHIKALLLSDTPPTSVVTAFLPLRKSPGFRRAFATSRLGRAGFAVAINEAMSWWGNSDAEWNGAVANWICASLRRDDEAISELIPFISVNLAALAPRLAAKAHLATLTTIARSVPTASKPEFWNLLGLALEALPPRRRAAIERLAADELDDSDAELRLALLSGFPRLWYSYRPPAELSGKADELDAINVAGIAFQPRSWRIAEALVKINPAAFGKALSLLNAHPSRQATLLLAERIGFKYLPRLGAVAVRTQANASPTGARLDAYYRGYKLPKQSGGTRTILVPAPWLKGLQRAIYQSLLQALPVHPAAHGFVPGRSICWRRPKIDPPRAVMPV